MRFRRPTHSERQHAKALKIQGWHKKFAWWPVRLHSDNNEVRWLEFVLRKGQVRWKHCEFIEKDFAVGHSWKYADSSLDVLRHDPEQQ
jgi:hypothetical protein